MGTAAAPAPSSGVHYRPIQDYALIGDGITAALVSLDGSIDWACFPRFDSPSVFGSVLDAAKGGCWSIAPLEPYTSHRMYIEDTNVLRTVFTTAGGTAELIDFMPTQASGPERLGESAIVRIVRGISGFVAFHFFFEPRFDYGRAETEWASVQPYGAQALWNGEALTLSTDVAVHPEGTALVAELGVTPGREVRFSASYRERVPLFWGQEPVHEARRWQEETEDYWRHWIGRCRYDGPHAALVRRSLLALKLLDYAPSGGIIAAPTTSLPEWIGGTRNWDYRYCWVRDASFILNAFYKLGYPEEGEHFLHWLLDCTQGDPATLRVMYRVGGERDLAEFELDHLDGYRGSRPVRIGNGAALQCQLDAYGEVLDAAWLLHEHGGHLSARLCRFLCAVVEYVCEHWQDADAGIWEIRGRYDHFVYSKVLCWVALDRGLQLSRFYDMGDAVERWRTVRDAIAAEVHDRGYDAERNTFRQAYDTPAVDAALLALPLRGFIGIADTKMLGTIDQVVADLSRDGLLLRYLPDEVDDGVGGAEGAFLLCSFWLVEVLARSGRAEAARPLFDRLVACANDLGLFAEQTHPATGDQLGNFPQGLTHVALVNAAMALADADKDDEPPTG